MGIDHLQYVQQRRDPNQDLVVINIPVDQWDALPALAKKKVQQSREFVSDNSCIRRLIITTKDDIANLPPEITGHCCSEKTARERVEEGEPDPFAGPNPAFRREDGYEGYKYLLKIFSGLDSPNYGEDGIGGQIFSDFQSYSLRNNDKRKLRKTFDCIKHDAKMLRTNYMHDIPNTGLTANAKELTQTPRDAEALIIAGDGELTRQMLHELGKDNSQRSKHVWIVASDAKQRENLERQAQIMHEQRLVTCNVTVVSPEEFFKEWLPELDTALDVAFICSPKREEQYCEQELLKHFKERENTHHPLKIAFLQTKKPSPFADGDRLSDDAPDSNHAHFPPSENIVFSSQIRAATEAKHAALGPFKEKLDVACERICGIRELNKNQFNPSLYWVERPIEEYAERCKHDRLI